MSSWKSEQEEAIKEMHKVEMEQFKYVAEEKAFSESPSKHKRPKTDYDFLIQMCLQKMDGYVKIYEDISRVIKVDVLTEIAILFFLVISVLTTFLAFGKIDETLGLDMFTFSVPLIFVFLTIVLNGLMVVGLGITRPIEHIYVLHEKK